MPGWRPSLRTEPRGASFHDEMTFFMYSYDEVRFDLDFN